MLLTDLILDLRLGKEIVLVLQVGASLSNLSPPPWQITPCNPSSFPSQSRTKSTKSTETFFGGIPRMNENHTSLTGKKFVLQRTEGDLGYAPPDLQTWPTSPNLAGKSSIPTLPHGAERFTANISGRIISGMSTKLAQLQGSGIASSPLDLYLPKGFAGGLDLVHPYHFGNTTQNPSFMIWTETPLNRTYPLQFLMFKPPTATGTYRSFSLFSRPSLPTRSVPS